jgi:membrane-associated phospholipid phosphatase
LAVAIKGVFVPDRRMVALIAGILIAVSGALSPALAGQSADDSLPRPMPAAFAKLFAPPPEEEPVKFSPAQVSGGTSQVPQEREHTGFGSLFRSTVGDFAAFPKRKSTYVILAIGAGAAALAHPIDDDVNEYLLDNTTLRRVFKPGKYLGYGWVQGGAAVGLYIVGRYAMEPTEGTHTNKVSHLGFDLLRANLLTQAFTYGIKYATQRNRPTGECCSFPSGHASVTFATASVLERHFGYRASWPMFAIAGYVSASRLTDNRHFVSDVVFGSALGIATGWTVVGRHGRENFALYPVPVRGGVVLAGSWSPGGTSHGAN